MSGICKHCYGLTSIWDTHGKNVKAYTSKGWDPRMTKPVKKKNTTKSSYTTPKNKPTTKDSSIGIEKNPVETQAPVFYQLDVTTTVDPRLQEYDSILSGYDAFTFGSKYPYDDEGNYRGWKATLEAYGASPEIIKQATPYAQKWVNHQLIEQPGSSFEQRSDYRPAFTKTTPLTSTTTNYYDQNMKPITSIPQGANVVLLPALNYKTGGVLNYFDYLQ